MEFKELNGYKVKDETARKMLEQLADDIIGENRNTDFGQTEHMLFVQRFVDEMNRTAKNLGMNNTTYKTPSGLPRNFINEANTTASTSYNSYTTAYDLLVALVGVKHAPFVMDVMGTESYTFDRNGEPVTINHGFISSIKTWAEENNLKFIAVKGGSLDGTVSENGDNGLKNAGMLIEYNNELYGISILGLKNTTADSLVLKTLILDLIAMVNGSAESAAITEASSRTYPVCMGAVKLTKSGTFKEDIALLANGVYINKEHLVATASTAKIMTALVCAKYFDNHYCTVNTDDIVGGSAYGFTAGESLTIEDAMYLMMLVSDNTMATLLARNFAIYTIFSKSDMQRVQFFGRDITTIETDTPKFWMEKGNGITYVGKTGVLNNQPVTYGFIQNIVFSNLIFQVLYAMNSNGWIYVRSGTANGWYPLTEKWAKLQPALLRSPNGTQYEITVTDDGTLGTKVVNA